MKIYIITHQLFDLNGKELKIGGIETYLLNLSKMFLNEDYTPIIYQLANNPWQIEYENIKIFGIKKLSTTNMKKQSKNILNQILDVATDKDLIIWGTDYISIKNHSITSIAIQHGIGFDYISDVTKKLQLIKKLKLQSIYKLLQRRKSINAFLNAKYKVCVDYNYLNWIRTMLPREELDNIHVIPNFTHVNDKQNINQQNNQEIKVLFARRFSEERGIFILIGIVDALIEKYKNVKFTIAGDGPYKKLLHNKYDHIENITITKYQHNESLDIHSKHHIAIIPTYGSEGTSLSLLEAMTSCCVPIASNIGGMTNIILDGYNGYLVNPTTEDFIEKLSLLIENDSLRCSISDNAKKSVDTAFNYEYWKKKWLEVLSKATK